MRLKYNSKIVGVRLQLLVDSAKKPLYAKRLQQYINTLKRKLDTSFVRIAIAR